MIALLGVLVVLAEFITSILVGILVFSPGRRIPWTMPRWGQYVLSGVWVILFFVGLFLMGALSLGALALGVAAGWFYDHQPERGPKQ